MSTNASVFNDRIQIWREEQNQPWMRLRYRLVEERLIEHFPSASAHVLDAGGGNGMDGIALAKRGNQVTLVDYSGEMLGAARELAAQEGVTEQFTFQQGDVTRLSTQFPENYFDAVLCHNVLQYVPSLDDAMHELFRVVRPGGVVSLIIINRYSESLRHALQCLDLEAALDTLDAREMKANLFDATLRLVTADELISALEGVGGEVVGRYGLQCVIPYIQDNTPKYDAVFFEQLVELERAVSSRYPYYEIGRFMHVVARKM